MSEIRLVSQYSPKSDLCQGEEKAPPGKAGGRRWGAIRWDAYKRERARSMIREAASSLDMRGSSVI